MSESKPTSGWNETGSGGYCGTHMRGFGGTHCPECMTGIPTVTARPAPSPDDLQRREYAKAALIGMSAHPANERPCDAARWAFDVADAMMTEQKKREAR